MGGLQIFHALARTTRFLGRALIGAVAGLIPITLTLSIITDYLQIFTFGPSPAGDRAFWTTFTLGIVAFALVAAVSGKARIRGKLAAGVAGALAGTSFGGIAGAGLGSASPFGVHAKSGVLLGIFFGGPLGAILGGLIGIGSYEPVGGVPSGSTDGCDLDGRGARR
ncbi:hypothetical protein ACYOEI_25195 [Singulisphaera rosea]